MLSNSKFLIALAILMLFVSAGVTYYKRVVQRDFAVILPDESVQNYGSPIVSTDSAQESVFENEDTQSGEIVEESTTTIDASASTTIEIPKP